MDHTGPLSWHQRAWAAVLFYAEAVLCDESALALLGLCEPAGSDLVHVAVDQTRRVSTRLPGVRLHRVTDLADFVHPAT